jgi:mono/diheme cytochrome c family protein
LKVHQLTIGLFSMLLLLTATFAQTPPSDTSLTGDPVFKKSCAKCHGKTAEGRRFGGPSLISEKTAAASAEDLRTMIADGKGRMPKFAGKLTSEQIDGLVRQIQKLNAK